MNSVQIKVAEQVAHLGPAIEDKVVDVMVSRERDKRSEALVKVLDLHQQAEKDLNKVRPDLSYMGEDGKVTQMYSKQQLENLNKAKKRVENIAGAINKALEKKDFSNVYNFAQGKEPVADDSAGDTPVESPKAA